MNMMDVMGDEYDGCVGEDAADDKDDWYDEDDWYEASVMHEPT